MMKERSARWILFTWLAASIVTTIVPATSEGHSLPGRGGFEPGGRAADCSVLPRPRLLVRLTIDQAYGLEAGPVVRQIVNETWRPEGLSFDWISGEADADPWTGVNVWIAVVSGGPSADDGGIMGEVLFNRGAPRRLIRIYLDAAVAWVRRDQAARFGTETRILNQSLGATAALVPRALGYVAAHEIGHFVLGSPKHSRNGLMQATYKRPARLLRESNPLELDPGNRGRLRARLAESAGCPY